MKRFSYRFIALIEFYNNRRIRTKLKGKSPVQYRELANQLVA
ncbi:IS3 family transposase [Limosilactobacillus fermentum]